MAKSRDTLIYVDAPGRRYFAKQNFSAEITHTEVCKIKKHSINNLHIYAYHLCNKTARKTLRKAVFCTAKSRQHGMKRRPLRLQKAVNRIAKSGLLQNKRAQTAQPKATFRHENNLKRPHSSLSCAKCANIIPLTHWQANLILYDIPQYINDKIPPHKYTTNTRQSHNRAWFMRLKLTAYLYPYYNLITTITQY